MFEWWCSLKNNNRSSQRAPVLSDKGKCRAEKSQLCKKKKKKSPQYSRDDIRKPLRGPSHSLLFLSHGDRLPSLARRLNPQPRSRAKLTQLPFLVKVSLCRSPSICLACSLVVSTHTHSYTQQTAADFTSGEAPLMSAATWAPGSGDALRWCVSEAAAAKTVGEALPSCGQRE